MVTGADLDFDTLGPQVTAAFREHGVVCLRGVLDAEWIELLREGVEAAIRQPLFETYVEERKAKARGGLFVESQASTNREQFRRFALASPIGRLAGLVLGAQEVRLYNDTIFVKEPGTIEPTPWHHDLPYFSIEGMQTCSSWIALDPVTSASGAMSFVPGSHHWGKLFQPRKLGLDNSPMPGAEEYDGSPPDIEADRARYNVVSFDLNPGDMTFHNLLTLHQAGPNSTASVRRRAHTMRMVGDDATWVDRPYSTVSFKTKLKPGEKLEGADFPVLWRRMADLAPAPPIVEPAAPARGR